MKHVTKYQISAINSFLEKCDEKCAYIFNVYKKQLSRQTGSRNLIGPKTLPTIWHTNMKLVTKYQIPVINSCLEKCDKKWAYMFNVYKKQLSRQTGSWNLMGPKTLHTIWHTNMKLVTKYQIPVINSCLEKCDEQWAYMFNVYKNQQSRQTGSRIWWVQKRSPPYGAPIWSLWPNIRSLPSIVAGKNATKNEHICSMCIKTNKVGKQAVGIWWVQNRFPQYGIPIWRLWPNIRFLSSIVA
jgi:hypothetical protein